MRKTPSVSCGGAAFLALAIGARSVSAAPTSPSAPAQPLDGVMLVEASPGCIPGWVVDAQGIRRLPDRCPEATAAAAAPGVVANVAGSAEPVSAEPVAALPAVAAGVSASSSAPAPSCDPPWYLDANGIKRLRMKCLAATTAPANRPAPARQAAAPTAAASKPAPKTDACDPPTFVDAQGIKRLRPRCL